MATTNLKDIYVSFSTTFKAWQERITNVYDQSQHIHQYKILTNLQQHSEVLKILH